MDWRVGSGDGKENVQRRKLRMPAIRAPRRVRGSERSMPIILATTKTIPTRSSTESLRGCEVGKTSRKDFMSGPGDVRRGETNAGKDKTTHPQQMIVPPLVNRAARARQIDPIDKMKQSLTINQLAALPKKRFESNEI